MNVNGTGKVMSTNKVLKPQWKMKQILQYFPVCRKTIERWCNESYDPLPHEKINGQYYFDPDMVEMWKMKRGNTAS